MLLLQGLISCFIPKKTYNNYSYFSSCFMTLLASSEKDSIQERPYQVRAWKNMGDFTKQRLRQTLGNPKNIDLWTTMTINMTTGS